MLPLIIKTNIKNPLEKLNQLALSFRIKPENIYSIEPKNKTITINQIRQLQKDLMLETKNKRMIVFFNFDSTQLVVQNSLLKTIEENNDNNLFIFLVNNLEKVISTIQSRSKIINWLSNSEDSQPRPSQEIINLIKEIKESEKPIFIFKKEFSEITQEKLIYYLDQLIFFFQEKLIEKSNYDVDLILKEFFKLRFYVKNNNLNSQLAFDHLLIFLWKKLKIKKE